jgi:hypothetical protein
LEFHYLHPHLLKIIRFEDVLGAPNRQASSLCEFLGLEDRAPEMVALKGAVANSSFDTAGVKTVRGGVLDLRSRPGAELDEKDKSILETGCGKRAAALGYDVLNGASERVSSACVAYQAALEQIPTRQLLYSFCRVVSKRLLHSLTRRK